MSTFPAASYLSNNARTEGEMKTALEDFLAATKQLPGGGAESTLEIASGVVTPTGTSHAVDTESSASTDDLTNISQTNLPDGSLLILHNLASGRAVVLKHGAGGTGELDLQGDADLALDDPEDFIVLRRDGSVWVEILRHRKADRQTVHKGHISGFRIANNGTDATNDIDVGAGEAASDDATAADRRLLIGAAMTKRIDATWAAGTNQGGRLAAESLADGTWHVFVFRRQAGAIDYFFSQSLTPTEPDSGTNKRRIASVLRESGALVAVTQEGDEFRRAAKLDVDVTDQGTSAVTRSLSVPTGYKVEALFRQFAASSTGGVLVLTTSPDEADDAPSATVAPLASQRIQTNTPGTGLMTPMRVRTNTSGQVRTRASAASTTVRIVTHGWIDRRGRDD